MVVLMTTVVTTTTYVVVNQAASSGTGAASTTASSSSGSLATSSVASSAFPACERSNCGAITLRNQGPGPVPAGSQVAIDIDWASYGPLVAPNLQNAQFLDPLGDPIPAWLESCGGSETSCSASSNSSLVWVKLDDSIQAGAQMPISIAFAPVSTNEFSPTGDWGESPLLSPAYAEFDNGAVVFNFYDDFAGPSLDGQWAVGTGENPVTVHDGLTVGPAQTENDANALSTNATFGEGIVDFYGTIPQATPTSSIYTYGGLGIAAVVPGVSGCCFFDDSILLGGYGGTFGLETGPSDGLAGGAGSVVSGLSFGVNGTYSILVPSTTPTVVTAQLDYAGNVTASSGLPVLPQPITFIDQQNTGFSIGPIFWIRERAYLAPDQVVATPSPIVA